MASAGDLYTTGNGQSKTLHYDAAPGEVNNLSMSFGVQNNTDVVWVNEWVNIVAGTGCQVVAGRSAHCALGPLIAIDIKLGGGNDRGASSTSPRTQIRRAAAY